MTAVLLTGAPYRVGDLLEVETTTGWNVARVYAIKRDDAAAFGCHWRLIVGGAGPVHVNDNGCNHTIGRKVRPSGKVDE